MWASNSERARDEWQQLTPAAKIAESELRDFAAKRIGQAAQNTISKDGDDDFQAALGKWNEGVVHLPEAHKSSRAGFVSQIVAEIERFG
jgi:hypothetical protein